MIAQCFKTTNSDQLFSYFLFQYIGLRTQATVTNLTAELETDAERFLTSVNENACREF